MLQIGVHHRDIRCAGRQHAFDTGPREPPPADPAQAPHAVVGGRYGLHDVRRAVRRIVVDKNDLPADAFEHRVQALHQLDDIAAFLEGGDDNGKLGHPAALRARSRLRLTLRQ
jgi:hypothetical protein